MIALAGEARRWEPKRLRLRLFSIAGRLVRGGRRRRPPPAAPPRRTMALGRRAHRRHRPPAGPPRRLTSRNSTTTRKEQPPGPVEPRPPGATAGEPAIADTRNHPPAQQLRPERQARERSRLGYFLSDRISSDQLAGVTPEPARSRCPLCPARPRVRACWRPLRTARPARCCRWTYASSSQSRSLLIVRMSSTESQGDSAAARSIPVTVVRSDTSD